MYFSDWARSLETVRRNIFNQSHGSPLTTLWSCIPKSFNKPWKDYSYLCVDLEFSDLDARKGDILSIGWVEIEEGSIKLSTAKHIYLKSRKTVGQSATIHNIRDCDVSEGLSISEAAAAFLSSCKGRILILHHGRLDFSYLNQASKRLFGSPLWLPYCDTMELEKTKILNEMGTIPPGALTLSTCRSRYSLPNYTQHNALVDALATAELFIAHLSGREEQLPLNMIRYA